MKPIVCAGQHVATAWTSPVFRRPPTRAGFTQAIRTTNSGLNASQLDCASQLYFNQAVSTEEQFSLASKLLGELGRLLGERIWQWTGGKTSAEPASIVSAKKFIQANVDYSITPKDVVHHIGVNHSYFARLFKNNTTFTLGQYIERARIASARHLLSNRRMPITDVAFCSGFGSIPNFNYMFKRQVGLTPTQYRNHLAIEVRQRTNPSNYLEKVKF